MKVCGFILALIGCAFMTIAAAAPGYFNENQIDIGFFDKNFLTTDMKRPPSPIFWTASTKASKGMTLLYERNIYHTTSHFSVNVGGDISWWQHDASDQQNLYTLSAFLDLRFWLFHTQYFSPYVTYAIAGPTLISRCKLGDAYLGEYFLFQDFMGIGVNIGHNPVISVSAKLWHYSNGDIFPRNNGFDVPILLSVGVGF